MKHSCNIPWAFYDLTRLECTGKVKRFAYLIVSLITIFAEGNLWLEKIFTGIQWKSLAASILSHSSSLQLTIITHVALTQIKSSLVVPLQVLSQTSFSSTHPIPLVMQSVVQTDPQEVSLPQEVPILLWHSCASPM